ncbi:MAG: hydrogenase maturation nickel metallochaperone HypA [Clostridiales bacterium]|nr:hydrogenase maturation nickel metallochaperone HypA [Clostridiales bacterium]
MHEYPITQQIIKIAEKHCLLAQSGSVKKISLVVGDCSGLVGDSIDMYFRAISEGSLCEGAMLEIERIEPKLRCPSCGALFKRKPMSFACPECEADGQPTEIGKEFYIKEIEVE